MQKMYYRRGHPTLEATIKNIAYGNKSELFLHIYIFFRTFAVANLRRGMSAHPRRGEQTYERRLLALCSDL